MSGAHEKAARTTLADARKAKARIPASLAEGLLGVARAWDEVEALGEALYAVPGLARQTREYVEAVQRLIPQEQVHDAWSELSAKVGNAKVVPIK